MDNEKDKQTNTKTKSVDKLETKTFARKLCMPSLNTHTTLAYLPLCLGVTLSLNGPLRHVIYDGAAFLAHTQCVSLLLCCLWQCFLCFECDVAVCGCPLSFIVFTFFSNSNLPNPQSSFLLISFRFLLIFFKSF